MPQTEDHQPLSENIERNSEQGDMVLPMTEDEGKFSQYQFESHMTF